MAGRRKGSGGKTDGWLFAEDIVFSIGQSDGRSAQVAAGDTAGDPHADADDASARAGRRRRISRSTVRRPRAPAADPAASPPAPVLITPPPANVAAARSLAGTAVTGPGPTADDDPVDGWPADAVARPTTRTYFGKRGVVRPDAPVPPVMPEPGAMGRTPSVAPERRVRLLEMTTPEHRAEPPPPPARRPVLRALAGVAVRALIIAGAGAAWVFVGDTLLPGGPNVAYVAPDAAPVKTELPLRAADAPMRSVTADPVAGAATPAVPSDGDAVARSVDPLLSSDRISAMGLPGSDGEATRPASPVPDIADDSAGSPADVPVVAAPLPGDDALRSTADGAPAVAGLPAGADRDVALGEPPAPEDVVPDPVSDLSALPSGATAPELAEPATPPLPPARPGEEVETAVAEPVAPTDILAGAAALEPDPTPTGSLPEDVDAETAANGDPEPGIDRPAGRVIIGRIIPPAEFEARLRGERPIVGQIIPPEEFDTPGAIDPTTRRTIESLIPPRDVGASPFAAEDPPPQVEAFDLATAGPPATASAEASVADVAGDNLRVVVHVPRTSDSGLDGQIGETFATMPGRVEIKVVNVRPPETMVRYYHAEDREAAQALRRQLAAAEGDWEVNLSDFTDYRPTPRKGLIEVWLSGSPRSQ